MPEKTKADKLEEIRNLYQDAERRIKEIEVFQEELPLPAINELRYAGHHLLRAEEAGAQDASDAELDKARNHCLRAIYDAEELRALSALSQFRAFNEDYRLVAVSESIPWYSEVKTQADNVSEILSNKPRLQEQGLSYIETLSSSAAALAISVKKLESSREVLNARLSKSRKMALSFLFTSAIGMVVSIGVGGAYFVFSKTDKGMERESIVEEIYRLDEIKESLATLQSYVDGQKTRLETLNLSISELKRKEKGLDEVITTKEKLVGTILEQYSYRNKSNPYVNVIISFFVGIFSSLTATFLVIYVKRRKSDSG